MMNLLNENNKWKLNIPLMSLTVNERRDSLVLLFFLNTYGGQIEGFYQLKKYWINKLYELPKTSSKGYDTIKNGRYTVLKKMKYIYQQYLVEIEGE
jgi:hypothetical protein